MAVFQPPPSLSRKRSETPPPPACFAREGEAGLCLSHQPSLSQLSFALRLAPTRRKRCYGHLPRQHASHARVRRGTTKPHQRLLKLVQARLPLARASVGASRSAKESALEGEMP